MEWRGVRSLEGMWVDGSSGEWHRLDYEDFRRGVFTTVCGLEFTRVEVEAAPAITPPFGAVLCKRCGRSARKGGNS